MNEHLCVPPAAAAWVVGGPLCFSWAGKVTTPEAGERDAPWRHWTKAHPHTVQGLDKVLEKKQLTLCSSSSVLQA